MVNFFINPKYSHHLTHSLPKLRLYIKFALGILSCMSAKIIPISRRKSKPNRNNQAPVAFNRQELGAILNVYGQMVTQGHWKDYAIDMLAERAVFSIYRQATQTPLYQINKRPDLRNKQGQYSVIAPGGLIIKRGHDLKTVLRVFDKDRFKSL